MSNPNNQSMAVVLYIMAGDVIGLIILALILMR
jgi:hypothetical protein